MTDLHKIILINKPKEWTSFDVVAKVRSFYSNTTFSHSQECENVNLVKRKVKVGHAGTLDPFATGLLIILIGKATKEQDQYMKLDKEYEATLRLGQVSTTGDPEGEITSFVIPTKAEGSLREISPCASLSRNDIEKALNKFKGEIVQTPPAFSAIKVNGERAYKLAREGKEVNLKSRPIILYSIDIIEYEWPKLELKVKCSTGTYVRTLAEDIGKELGCGAYLTDLKRTSIGDYTLEDAKEISEISLT